MGGWALDAAAGLSRYLKRKWIRLGPAEALGPVAAAAVLD